MPEHNQSIVDEQLINRGIQTLKEMVEETNGKRIRWVHKTCVELHLLAQQSRRKKAKISSNR